MSIWNPGFRMQILFFRDGLFDKIRRRRTLSFLRMHVFDSQVFCIWQARIEFIGAQITQLINYMCNIGYWTPVVYNVICFNKIYPFNIICINANILSVWHGAGIRRLTQDISVYPFGGRCRSHKTDKQISIFPPMQFFSCFLSRPSHTASAAGQIASMPGWHSIFPAEAFLFPFTQPQYHVKTTEDGFSSIRG